VEGGAKIFGVFRVKNHDFTPKNHIFSNFRGGGRAPGAPPAGSAPAFCVTSFEFNNRICLSCNIGAVENEVHFLNTFSTFEPFRKYFLQKMNNLALMFDLCWYIKIFRDCFCNLVLTIFDFV
jgi:hypothetical protein